MAAAKPKTRRGGARTGAGRKPKGYVPPTQLADIDIRAALIGDAPDAIETEAQAKVRTSFESLITIIKAAKSEAAKVAACRTILDRGYGKPSVETGVDQSELFMGVAPTATISGEIRALARRFALLAIEVLHRVATAGASESARVAAAKVLLDRGLGTVGVARMPGLAAPEKTQFGKKELAEPSAATAGAGTDWGDDLRGYDTRN